MKIGILTLPQEKNFGGTLQAFALQRILKKMGHEAYIIDRHNPQKYSSFLHHLLSFGKRCLKRLCGNRNVSIAWNPWLSAQSNRDIELFRVFINQNMALTHPCYSGELKKIDEEYKFDAYVVGSDQVWLDYYCPESFLDFVSRKEVIRVVYAASCGKQSFFKDNNKVRKCKELSSLFKGISVREIDLIDSCKKSLNINPEFVLDPTLLISTEEYINTIDNTHINKPFVFCYILDASPEKQKEIEFISNLLGFSLLGLFGGELLNIKNVLPFDRVSVGGWLSMMSQASFVVTDSFHGTAFSLLFNKNFVTIGNTKRGLTRFKSILKLFDLEDRLVLTDDYQYIESKVNAPIDYSKVNKILDHMRKKSIVFLKKSLQDEKYGI